MEGKNNNVTAEQENTMKVTSSQAPKVTPEDRAALQEKIAEHQDEQLARHLDQVGANKTTWFSRLLNWIRR